MHIVVLGINHKTAPVEIREMLTFSEASLQKHLLRLKEINELEGCTILSTCNRTEIYAVLKHGHGLEAIRNYLSVWSGIDVETIKKHSYVYRFHDMVHHLFRVAAGLDSMVIGETQILGQLRSSYDVALECGATNGILNNLFQHAITTGKRVRSETKIDQMAVSISYVAVELAKQVFGSLKGCSVLVIGAGEMSELTAKHLVANGVSGVIVSNRSYERAVELADVFGGRAVKFNDLYDNMGDADIVISCTAAMHYVVKSKDIEVIMQGKQGKKLMFVDIAVPRDIEPGVGALENVSLYDIDDLQNVVDENLADRKRIAQIAEGMVNEETEKFMRWLGIQYVIPTVAALKMKGENIKRQEIKRATNRLGELTDHDRKVITSMANSIVNQLLHDPVVMLKQYALTADGKNFREAVEKLFRLEEDRDHISPAAGQNIYVSEKKG
ncbi:MAG TPA: glutamyl-tRNA reductase [Clostridia bacterium]|nr:glutamyl-tRNA reductase [Clostridia bacterium]